MDEKFCPKCDSNNISMEAGGTTGTWVCVECGYVGIVPEREIEKNNYEKDEDIIIKSKRRKK